MKYRDLLKILRDEGFEQTRQKGSHRTLKGTVKGKTQVVQVAYHQINDDVAPGTLGSIIRQSRLSKKKFR